MKKVMFAALALIGSASVINATTTVNSSTVSSYVSQDDRVKIKPEELPDAVKTTLAGDEYKGWLIDAAYWNKTTSIYELEVKKGAETQTLKFKKDGTKAE